MSTTTAPHPAAAAWPTADPEVMAPVEEHDDLRAVARSILAKHSGPEQVAARADGPVSGPSELWALLSSELDVAGIAVPEALGGSGYGLRELAVVLEETGAALVSDPVLSSAVLGTQALVLAEEPSLVADLLGAVQSGGALLSVWFGPDDALTAAESGRAWTVSGRASRVLDGASVSHVVVSATSQAGPVLVVVEVDSAGVAPREVVDGTRPQADVVFTDAPARLLAAPSAHDVTRRRLTTLRDVAVASEHAGIIGRLLEATVDHVVTREQFGRPIGSFQAIKHRLADVLVDRERCLSASRYAAAVYDRDPEEATVAATVAIAVSTDAVLRTVHETVQLHGGIGFTWEHFAHRYVRRALGDEGLFGSAHSHRLRLASLLGF